MLCYYNKYGHSHFPCRVKHKDLTLRKKLSFPLRVSAVNVTKAARNCGFGHIDHRNPKRKIHFLSSVTIKQMLFHKIHVTSNIITTHAE